MICLQFLEYSLLQYRVYSILLWRLNSKYHFQGVKWVGELWDEPFFCQDVKYKKFDWRGSGRGFQDDCFYKLKVGIIDFLCEKHNYKSLTERFLIYVLCWRITGISNIPFVTYGFFFNNPLAYFPKYFLAKLWNCEILTSGNRIQCQFFNWHACAAFNLRITGFCGFFSLHAFLIKDV